MTPSVHYDPAAVNAAVSVTVTLELSPAGYFEYDGVQVRRVSGNVRADGSMMLRGNGKQVLKTGAAGASNRVVWSLPASRVPASLAAALRDAAREAVVAAAEAFRAEVAL